MCGRYSLQDTEQLKLRFETSNNVDFAPRYNIAPTQELPVIVAKEHKTLALMRWGLVPFWAKDTTIGYKLINARAETVDTLPSYKKPFRTKRCLVPASGFFEWKKEGSIKTPFYFHLKNNHLFAFAGLYDVWRNKDGSIYTSYTIITTTANSVVKPVHPERMPVMLQKKDEDTWLNPDIVEPAHLKPLLVPYPDDLMEAYQVGREVNTYKQDTPDIIAPLTH